MNLQYNDLVEDICLVIDENKISKLQRNRLKKKIKKLAKRNKLNFNADSLWIWRLCAARLMRGEFDTWYGFEFRSKWSAAFVQNDWIYPKWEGKNCKLIVLAEQGIGDEILFASTYNELLKDCPDATIEADHRLLPTLRRSFPHGKFISRWVNDADMTPQNPNNYKKGEYEAFIPAADLLKVYRTGKRPSGEPYMIPDPEKVERKKKYLDSLSYLPKIGLSWMGGRSNLEPEKMKKQDGIYIGLQYKKEDGKIVSDPGPEWVHDCGVDHNDFDDLYALVSALDEVNTVQSVITHIAGSQGKKTNVIKPPPMYATDDNPDNNRLKWAYGMGGRMPWYKSVYVYNNWQDFQINK